MQNLFMNQQNVVLDNSSLRRGFTVLVSLHITNTSASNSVFSASYFYIIKISSGTSRSYLSPKVNTLLVGGRLTRIPGWLR